MTDEQEREAEALRQRLRSADPARAVPPPAGLAADLTRLTRERAMQDTPQPDDTGGRRPRWVPLAAAAAVLAIGGTAYVATRDADPAPPPSAGEPTVTELVLPTGQPGRCMQVSAQTVANAGTAFEGTVTAVEDGSVELEVSRWFVGGDADRVRLASPPAGGVRPPLPGQPEFGRGERWLVTATDGRVNVCGFTAPWSPGLADVFDEAFAG